MVEDLESLEPLGAEMARRARAAGVVLIWRTQSRSVRRIVVRQGRTEGTSASFAAGHGIQVVTAEGRTALSSRDDLRPTEALRLLAQTIELASQGAELGIAPARLGELRPVHDRVVAGRPAAFDEIELERIGRRLGELESEVNGLVPGIVLRLSYQAELDVWRIFRDDGTDVLFAMPRCTLALRATGGSDRARHGVSAVVFSPRPDLPWDEERTDCFLKRAAEAARLARDLPDAPPHPAGSFPLVIDYALAKGLAHEAFGHSAEADGFRSSVLARDGRFRTGDVVGAGHVSIVDEPVPDDHAWQPYGANGVRRAPARVVDHGRLAQGLSDIWSAEAGGIALTGAARAESFHHAPQPRMTNIRIEVDQPLAAPGEFEDYGPTEVRELLREAGVLRRHERVSFLSGYAGGQANTTTGDFVFNCKAIYAMSPERIELHKPAIFSGSMFGALHAVREAFGPLKLDALGHCGKWGQSVPSSGGSHYFLVFDPDPAVKLGGR